MYEAVPQGAYYHRHCVKQVGANLSARSKEQIQKVNIMGSAREMRERDFGWCGCRMLSRLSRRQVCINGKEALECNTSVPCRRTL